MESDPRILDSADQDILVPGTSAREIVEFAAMENNRKLRILFVDDEPSILRFIPHLLGKFKNEWDIETATSASKGLQLLADSEFEVVVSDLNMPGVGGVEFLKQV